MVLLCAALFQVLLLLVAGDASEPSCSGPIDNCRSTRCCRAQGHQCFVKDQFWASCKPDCTPGINPYDPPEYQQPWSCEILSPVRYDGTTIASDFVPPAGSVVAQHGQLSVRGTQLIDSHGNPIRLRGMSLFWSQWGSKYWTPDVINWLKEDWNVTLIRAPMGVASGGYLEGMNVQKSMVTKVVDAAVRAGLYVIIDWHDHEAEKHTEEARGFFEEFSKMYGHLPNVLFEIFNEPLKESWHDDIKPYEQEIVNLIRNHTDNVIICGTRQWSQDVDVAAEDPLVGDNLVYTLHFYAAYHKAELRQKALAALDKGVALFASEWGTCYFDGNGTLDLDETKLWLEFLEQYNISDANWAINDKEEACSAIIPGAGDGEGSWAPEALTDSGRFVRESLRQPLVYWPAPDVAKWEAEGLALAGEAKDGSDDSAKDGSDDSDDDAQGPAAASGGHTLHSSRTPRSVPHGPKDTSAHTQAQVISAATQQQRLASAAALLASSVALLSTAA